MVQVSSVNQLTPVSVSPSTGTTDHDKLANRDIANQHPIRAITGLREALLDNETSISTHIADKNNPHEVTKAQVGLGNVDNTSDADKPVSTAMQSALDLKVNTADLGNAELDIQKNGTSVGKFTANASTDKVINLIIPTQASDINALPNTTKYGATLVLSINSSTYVVTAQLKDQNGDNLGSAQTIDLPLESVVVNGTYDSENKKIILTLQNGNTIEIPVGDLIAGLQTEITSDNKLSADLVDDTSTTHKFVTASEKAQIATNTGNISSLQSGKADKATTIAGYGITDAYTKTQVDTFLSGKANIGLDNLSSDGQMIIDSQNGTISNCVLEIPQNLNLTLSNNVLTLKTGSILTLTGSTYSTYTLTSDVSMTIPNTLSDGLYMPTYTAGGGLHSLRSLSIITSGSSLPENPSNGDVFFNTTDKKIYIYSTSWSEWNVTYPFCVIEMKSGVASFAKFSDGRDCIFNGIGFVGQTKFIYPNVKVLEPIGKNADGTLKSKVYTTDSLQLSTSSGTYNRRMFINGDLFQITSNPWYYDENTNFWYNQDNNPLLNGGVYLGNCFTVDGIVTDFTVRQPIKLVTNEMMDKKADDSNVVKLTGNQTIAGVKIFTANPVMSNAQPQMQFVDSDFSKGTVPLSALRNTFFVLRDATNLDSGDMGSLFQRVDEYGNNYIAMVAFKNTSGSNDNAQMGIYYNTDGTSYATCPTPPAGDNSVKIATTKWVNDYFASITGYDATKTQTLKNVNGTLTWVDD